MYRKVRNLILGNKDLGILPLEESDEIYVSSLGDNRISIILKCSDADGTWFDEYIYNGEYVMHLEGLTDKEYEKIINGAV